MAAPLIPKEALAYIKNKKLSPAFSYKDVWNEEHATMFTVAKAMQIDVLSDIKSAAEAAVENGETLESFRKNLKPVLQEKGWWGKKEMADPLTGKTVNARLGSDRRLKTIYDTNTRSAYQEGRWERSQASTSHPYLMYRVGNSRHHRQDHLAWDGLVLPKDDPWWNSHYPPNGWGCKCRVMAVSEERKQRLEKSGVAVPPSADGEQGYTVPVRTQAPPVRYKTFYNERKGVLERIPEGISPGFNWNQGRMGRDVPLLQQAISKTRNEAPEQFDSVVKSLMANTVRKADYDTFIQKALTRQTGQRSMAPVGIFDNKIIKSLKGEGINLEEQSIIILESKLVNAGKFSGRHTAQQNAPAESDWHNLMDYLIDAAVFLDRHGLIYLRKLSESRYMKIVVDLDIKPNAHRGAAVKLPKVDTMYLLDISSEHDRGITEYNRIMKLKKIR
ncbi:MAG: phage head morphogenesis protein [Treponema sp.]|jgi:SPP1 gp7 family putative phage head morphogenesis protein|nr:phage head morphogenesis protein [Treponema sp.]